MSAMRVLTTGAAMAVLAFAWGCRKKDEPAHKGPPATVEAPNGTAPATGSPMSYSANTPAAEVALKLPAIISHEPDLHARLYAEGVRDLKAFAEGSANARAEEGGEEGETAAPPYNKTIEWSLGADTSKLLSLSSLQSEYTGGAHGNASYGSVLWDKALKRLIAPTALFAPGADAAMDKALCDALIAEKQARLGADYTPPSADTWTCPKWRDTPFELAASTAAGKAGGLTFLIAPYVAGAYAEGTYEPTVPLAAFRAFLKPAYADEFAGAPRPKPAAPTQTAD